LTKTVLANLAIVSGIYEQLDRAEDELLGSLGDLSTWLGHGYGLKDGVWDTDNGVRNVKREKRKREREDLEVMVQHGVDNVRVELKRRGLAGGGATARYEVSRSWVWRCRLIGRNLNKDIITKPAHISLLDLAQWRPVIPLPISTARPHPLRLTPPIGHSWQRLLKWI
jgi:hypothetical protein